MGRHNVPHVPVGSSQPHRVHYHATLALLVRCRITKQARALYVERGLLAQVGRVRARRVELARTQTKRDLRDAHRVQQVHLHVLDGETKDKHYATATHPCNCFCNFITMQALPAQQRMRSPYNALQDLIAQAAPRAAAPALPEHSVLLKLAIRVTSARAELTLWVGPVHALLEHRERQLRIQQSHQQSAKVERQVEHRLHHALHVQVDLSAFLCSLKLCWLAWIYLTRLTST